MSTHPHEDEAAMWDELDRLEAEQCCADARLRHASGQRQQVVADVLQDLNSRPSIFQEALQRARRRRGRS